MMPSTLPELNSLQGEDVKTPQVIIGCTGAPTARINYGATC